MLVYGDFVLHVVVALCTSVFGLYLFSALIVLCVYGLLVNRL